MTSTYNQSIETEELNGRQRKDRKHTRTCIESYLPPLNSPEYLKELFKLCADNQVGQCYEPGCKAESCPKLFHQIADVDLPHSVRFAQARVLLSYLNKFCKPECRKASKIGSRCTTTGATLIKAYIFCEQISGMDIEAKLSLKDYKREHHPRPKPQCNFSDEYCCKKPCDDLAHRLDMNMTEHNHFLDLLNFIWGSWEELRENRYILPYRARGYPNFLCLLMEKSQNHDIGDCGMPTCRKKKDNCHDLFHQIDFYPSLPQCQLFLKTLRGTLEGQRTDDFPSIDFPDLRQETLMDRYLKCLQFNGTFTEKEYNQRKFFNKQLQQSHAVVDKCTVTNCWADKCGEMLHRIPKDLTPQELQRFLKNVVNTTASEEEIHYQDMIRVQYLGLK